jgi:chromosome segregation ATPase
MLVNNVPIKADVEVVDWLGEKICGAISGVENLRAENQRLTTELRSLEGNNLQLKKEVQSLGLTLDQQQSERRHHHSLANEIITRLDVVGQTIEDVVKRAEHDVYRRRQENPRAELPEAELPIFLKKVEALVNSFGEKPKPLPQM